MSDSQKNSSSQEKKDDSLIGQLFDDKYRITDKIGGGGMGLVYEAQHEWMERKVALKVLRPNFIDADEYEIFLERFKREAQTASRINHPNAVTIYDFGIYRQMPYLAMQYIQGLTFTELIKRDGPMEETRAITLILQVLDATIAAHTLQIIHRDIKPDNVMMSKSTDGIEIAHVLDFGIAKVLDNSEANANMTLPGKTVGTPRYMSPEQVLAKPIDARTDIYALGLVLYEMLSGDIPFKADSSMQLMFHHVNTPPLPIREVYSIATISKQLERLIMKALEKDPGKRFQSCKEMKEALEALVKPSENKTAISLPKLPSLKKPQLPTLSLKELPKSSIGAGIAALILVVGLILWPSSKEELETGADSEQVALQEQSIASDNSLPATSNTSDIANKEVTQINKVVAAKETTPVSKEEITANIIYPIVGIESVTKSAQDDPKNKTVDPKTEATKTEETVELATIPTSEPKIQVKKEEGKEKKAEQKSTGISTQKKEVLPPTPIKTDSTTAKQTEPKKEALTQKLDAKRPYAKTKVSTLIGYLAGEDRKVREAAAIELQSRGNAPVPALINTLQSHKSARARYWAVFILGKLRATEATEAIVNALEDPSGMVSQTAKKALRATNPKRANQVLGEDEQKGRGKDSGFMGLF